MIMQSKKGPDEIALYFYDETTKQMTAIGYINQKSDMLNNFIQSFNPADIRLI